MAGEVRQALAVVLKRMVERRWHDAAKLAPADRAAIKELLPKLMLEVPGPLQKQLSMAIVTIGEGCLEQAWPSLIPFFVQQFGTGDFGKINGVLRTADPLFERYRHEDQSDELWTEINYVLSLLCDPLTKLMAATIALTEQHASNPAALRTLFDSLTLISKLFYSLSYQDLPPYF